MLIKRLTLACEVTFWLAVAAAVGAPQISFAARSTVGHSPVSPLASIRSLPGKVSILYAQKHQVQTPALDELADHYEAYSNLLHL